MTPDESVIVIEKAAEPEPVGVPLRSPEGDSVNPGWIVPLVTAKVYGGVPPATPKTVSKFWEYGIPIAPGGRTLVPFSVITGNGVTVIAAEAVVDGLLCNAAVTVQIPPDGTIDGGV